MTCAVCNQPAVTVVPADDPQPLCAAHLELAQRIADDKLRAIVAWMQRQNEEAA